jgi:glycosyltransferase involved in cell wall biosynthesis
MKIIITHPDFADPGGVANYYLKLKNKFTLPVQHHIIGKRPGRNGPLSHLGRLIGDYARFLKNLQDNKNKVVVLNPSFDFKSLLRDGVFLLLAKIQRCKTIVFFRGWHKGFEQKLKRNTLWLFRLIFKKADAFIVLSKEVKEKLESWGFSQPIYREVTVIEDAALRRFDIHKTILSRQNSQSHRILFLSRVLKTKGIYETIEAVSFIQSKYPNIDLIIAGDGDELESVKAYVSRHSISNVIFTGYVAGNEKQKLLKNAFAFCLPSYSEGMPNVVVEAMAFGLPIVTRSVGGMVDFFTNGENGFMTHSKNPKIFANFIERLLLDANLYSKISLHNYQYAQSNFLVSRAVQRLEQICSAILQKN